MPEERLVLCLLRRFPTVAPRPSRIDARRRRSAPNPAVSRRKSMRLCAAGPQCASRGAPVGGRETRCVEGGRAYPTFQRAPELHLEIRGALNRPRVNSSLHGALPASTACRATERVSCSRFVLVKTTSDVPGGDCGRALRRAPATRLLTRLERGARERPRAPRAGTPSTDGAHAKEASVRRPSANRDETRARPASAHDPARRCGLAPCGGWSEDPGQHATETNSAARRSRRSNERAYGYA
jgi:hypothetical protein